MILTDQIRSERLRRNWSQQDLAAKAGLTQSQLSRIEHGADVRLSTLLEVARVLDLDIRLVPREMVGSVDHIMAGRNHPEPSKPDLPPRFAGEEEDAE
jgi:HTH-type transcriptional regulator/antitoxin HipB